MCVQNKRHSKKRKLGFTVNVGISDVKVLAKMASDFTKPDKVHTLYRREIKEKKMWQLPVEELYMAGKSSVNTLHKLEYTILANWQQALNIFWRRT